MKRKIRNHFIAKAAKNTAEALALAMWAMPREESDQDLRHILLLVDILDKTSKDLTFICECISDRVPD